MISHWSSYRSEVSCIGERVETGPIRNHLILINIIFYICISEDTCHLTLTYSNGNIDKVAFLCYVLLLSVRHQDRAALSLCLTLLVDINKVAVQWHIIRHPKGPQEEPVQTVFNIFQKVLINKNLIDCLRKQRTHKRTKIGNTFLLSLFIKSSFITRINPCRAE